LREYQTLPVDIRLMIMDIYKVEQWKKDIEKWKADMTEYRSRVIEWERDIKAWKKKLDANEDSKPIKPYPPPKPYKPLIRTMPTKFETIEEMVASDLYNQIDNINFSDNNLPVLPVLPQNLVVLNCQHNALTELPPLPDTITHLDISYNQFVILPDLPPRLRFLSCTNNQIEYIGQIPNTLEHLICYDNKLKHLPELESRQTCTRGTCYNNFSPDKNEVPCLHYHLTYVMCSGNPLESFPDSYKRCMKCGGQNLELWDGYIDKFHCKDCYRLISIQCHGIKTTKSKILNPWEFEDCPLGKIIQSQFGGNILAYLLGATDMEIDEETSGDDEGTPIHYDNIS